MFFGSSSTTTKEDSSKDSKDKQYFSQSSTRNDSGSNYSKCKAIPFPYTETKETTLRVENIGLFDGKTLLLDKLHQQFLEEVKKFEKEKTKYEDEYRPNEANAKGGMDFNNKEITSLIRSAGTELIKSVGKKIISGDFNLTTISFPIKVMIPLSILQSISRSFFQFPYYMHLAIDKEPLERFKLTIIASISSFFCSCFFLKPLNPILGETYEAHFSDGSKIYLEQTSHHPPVSHYEVYGPNNNWYYAGYSNYKTSAGLNSTGVQNNGKRIIKFKDGQKISFDFSKELFSNIFWGVIRHETEGEVNYVDEKNGIKCKVKLGGIKGKPSDALSGEIICGDKKVTISGSYLSHIEFDGVRYWDIRENFPIYVIEMEKNLPSSCIYRIDRQLLEEEKLEEAQEAKEKLENIQRGDRKLREKFHKK